MTGWGILAIGAALAAAALWAHWINVRARRQRRYLRHISGTREWWGKR